MKKLLTLTIFATGCGKLSVNEKNESAKYAIHELECTEAEASRVQNETEFCGKHTGFLSSYCYQAAMNRICTPKALKGMMMLRGAEAFPQ